MFRFILVLACLLPTAASAFGDCPHRAERSLDVDAGGLDRLKLDTRAGDLRIRGVAGLAKIEVRGIACADDEKTLAQIDFEQRRVGATAEVATRIPDVDAGWFGTSPTLDVEIRVPEALALDLRDSSGDIDIAALRGMLTVQDSSGDVTVEDIVSAELRDSSGDLSVRRASGDVTVVVDSSGDITLDDIKGQAAVRDDSSGDIAFRRIGGNAEVGNDSSGDISFDTIGGSARVGADGSGEIRAAHVRGEFSVDRKADVSDIRYVDIGGKVSLPTP